MTDRELLEMAAKAAGIDAEFHSELGYGPEGMWLKGARSPDNSKYWNPLTDDGDRYRLLRDLKMKICFKDTFVRCQDVIIMWPENEPTPERATVRAAAEIGKSMS